ncbi:endospore germination permease [Paenibacillus sp. KQZ6P-2]|uniref:Endospore germination permease n=1 Tax=Paenibacillus mangrovi TaxID=2931978 RepID=A0A9X2B7J7_9BACL|nr:endospore germination permease [Paenibacillus mangrovi]MCJ8013728.1 endospore germination permease [Paenibacillus mangrovi]
MLEKGRLSTRQFTVLIFLSCIGDMILIYPSAISSMSRQDAWISSLLGLLGGLLVLWLMLHVSQLHPDKTLVEAIQLIFGKWLGSIVNLWYLFYFFMLCSYLVREVGDFLTTQIFLNTPLKIIYLLFILLMVYALHAGLESIGRSSEILLPIFLLVAMIFIFCLLPQSKPENLKPFLENGAIPVLYGAYFASIYPFGELIVLLMVIPYVKREQKIKKDIIIVALGAGLLLSLIILVSLLVLGVDMTINNTYPTYFLAQKINIGNFLQRIESTMAVAWLISTFSKAVICYYAFTMGVAQLTGLSNQKILYFPAAIMLFGMADLAAPDVLYYLKHIVPYWMDWDLTNAVVIPCILWITWACRRKWKGKS